MLRCLQVPYHLQYLLMKQNQLNPHFTPEQEAAQVITKRSTHLLGQTPKIWCLLLHLSTFLGEKLQKTPPSTTWNTLCCLMEILRGDHCTQNELSWGKVWSLLPAPTASVVTPQGRLKNPAKITTAIRGDSSQHSPGQLYTTQRSGVTAPHLYLPLILDS